MTPARILQYLSILSSLLAVTTTLQPEAQACGGCIAPPGAFTAVNSHRMVIKLGIEETILWDQFIYSGAPEEFAWILPVPSEDTIVELAEADFIDTLDRQTAPIVLSPPCEEGAGGCDGGCGDSSGFSSALAEQVKVTSHKMVGPYETSVINSENPNAIYAWLSENNYAFPPSGRATLDSYANAGSHFVVLRLRPGIAVSAMQPIRVRYQGYMGQFPLKMIAIGATGAVDLSLWVIADQRYSAANTANLVIPEQSLGWNFETNRSNYEEVFNREILDAGGRAWVTEYAARLPDSALEKALLEQVPTETAILKAGMHVPFITRLRTKLLVEYLDEDLLLGPARDATEITRTLTASNILAGQCPVDEPAGAGPTQISALWRGLWPLCTLFLLVAWRPRRRIYQVFRHQV